MLYSVAAWPGRIYKLSLDGKLLGMLDQSGKRLKQFGRIHALAYPSENVLWVVESKLAGAKADLASVDRA